MAWHLYTSTRPKINKHGDGNHAIIASSFFIFFLQEPSGYQVMHRVKIINGAVYESKKKTCAN
jgi:hypothetical protein